MCENIKDQTTKTNQTYNTNNQIPNRLLFKPRFFPI